MDFDFDIGYWRVDTYERQIAHVPFYGFFCEKSAKNIFLGIAI